MLNHKRSPVLPKNRAFYTNKNYEVVYLMLNHKRFPVLDACPTTKEAIEKVNQCIYSLLIFESQEETQQITNGKQAENSAYSV